MFFLKIVFTILLSLPVFVLSVYFSGRLIDQVLKKEPAGSETVRRARQERGFSGGPRRSHPEQSRESRRPGQREKRERGGKARSVKRSARDGRRSSGRKRNK